MENIVKVKIDIPKIETKTELSLPIIGKDASGLNEDEALKFIKDCAQGKTAIAGAITDKGVEASEYDSFADLADKIHSIPLPTAGESDIMPCNKREALGDLPEVVLSMYDVYNDMRKAWSLYGGQYKGCCAIETTNPKNYSTGAGIALSGADLYVCSDGYSMKSTDSSFTGEHIFTDEDMTNRYIIYFFSAEIYTVPLTSLDSYNTLALYILTGKPKLSVASFRIAHIYSFANEGVDVTDNSVFRLSTISLLSKAYINHISKISGGNQIIHSNGSLTQISLPSLTTISGGSNIFYDNSNLTQISLPSLTTISGGSNIFYDNSKLTQISLPSLTTISGGSNIFYSNSKLTQISLPSLTTISGGQVFFNTLNGLDVIYLPKLERISGIAYLFGATIPLLQELSLPSLVSFEGSTSLSGLVTSANTTLKKITFGQKNVESIRILHMTSASQTNTTITAIEVPEYFKGSLDCSGCNGLTHDSLMGIINNLADNTDGEPINIIFGSVNLAKLTEEEIQIATDKNYTLS